MKLSKYRVGAGHYRVEDWVIYGGNGVRWQVRDELDDIVEDFVTLRDALRYAIREQQNRRAVYLARNIRSATLPIHPSELTRMLHN